MEKVLLDKMENLLLQQKDEIIQNLMSEDEDFKDFIKELDPGDLADIASDDISLSTLETLSGKDQKRLRLIDSALSRIKNGRFGVCMRCGKKIPEARLEAIPYALMCIQCQSTDERRNR